MNVFAKTEKHGGCRNCGFGMAELQKRLQPSKLHGLILEMQKKLLFSKVSKGSTVKMEHFCEIDVLSLMQKEFIYGLIIRLKF